MSNINLDILPFDVMSIITQSLTNVDLSSMKMVSKSLKRKIDPLATDNIVYMFKGLKQIPIVIKRGKCVEDFLSEIPQEELIHGGTLFVVCISDENSVVDQSNIIKHDISSFNNITVHFYNFKRNVGETFIIGRQEIKMNNCLVNPIIFVNNSLIEARFTKCDINSEIFKPLIKNNEFVGKLYFEQCNFNLNTFDFDLNDSTEVSFFNCDLDNNKIDGLLHDKCFNTLELKECGNVDVIPKITIKFLIFCSVFDEDHDMLWEKHDISKCKIKKLEFD